MPLQSNFQKPRGVISDRISRNRLKSESIVKTQIHPGEPKVFLLDDRLKVLRITVGDTRLLVLDMKAYREGDVERQHLSLPDQSVGGKISGKLGPLTIDPRVRYLLVNGSRFGEAVGVGAWERYIGFKGIRPGGRILLTARTIQGDEKVKRLAVDSQKFGDNAIEIVLSDDGLDQLTIESKPNSKENIEVEVVRVIKKEKK